MFLIVIGNGNGINFIVSSSNSSSTCVIFPYIKLITIGIKCSIYIFNLHPLVYGHYYEKGTCVQFTIYQINDIVCLDSLVITLPLTKMPVFATLDEIKLLNYFTQEIEIFMIKNKWRRSFIIILQYFQSYRSDDNSAEAVLVCNQVKLLF